MSASEPEIQPSTPTAPTEPILSLARASFIAAAVSIGLQITLALVILLGPRAPKPKFDQLTTIGTVNLHPEYDIPAFGIGALITFAFALLVSRMGNRYLARFDQPAVRDHAAFTFNLNWTVSLAGLFAFWVCAEAVRRSAYNRWTPNAIETLLLLAPIVLASGLLALHYLRARNGLEKSPLTKLPPLLDPQNRSFARIIDLSTIILIVLMIYIPSVPQFMGRLYLAEQFFHWDHFLMTAAVQYTHGGAFGVDFYSQYGVGFPMLYALLAPLLPLTYTNVLHTAILYGCLYYVGLYILLRHLTPNPLIALAALLFALFLTIFAPVIASLYTLWQWPSTTILRAPFDVWLLLALLTHTRSAKHRWLYAVGILTALSLLFELDTGLPLAAIFGLYLIVHGRAASPRHAGGSALVASAVFLAGLVIAGRGTPLTDPAAFWPGLLQGVLASGQGGIGSLVFLSRISIIHIVYFSFMSLVFLFVVARSLPRLRNNQLDPTNVFFALVALYGLSRLAVFLSRSLPNNLTHPAIPLVVILAATAAYLYKNARLEAANPIAKLVHALLPYAAIVTAALLIWFSPTFHRYPSLAKTLAKGAPTEGRYLIPEQREIGGLPEESAPFITQFSETLVRLRELDETGASIAVLDDESTIYYLHANVAPWGRDSTIFYNTPTLSQRDELLQHLLDDRPDYIFIRPDSPDPYYGDTWQVLHDALPGPYEPAGRAGIFELWSSTPR